MEGCILFTPTGLHIPMEWALFWVTSTYVIQKKDDSMSGTRHSPVATRERPPCSFLSFPHVFEIAQSDCTRMDFSALGIIRTMSRIDRIFINLPVAEARYFQCYSNVFENLENQSTPTDHAAVRLVDQKPTPRGHPSKRIPCWMAKHPMFCSLMQRLHDDHSFSLDPFVALAEFKVLLVRVSSSHSPRLVLHMMTCAW